MRLVAERTWGPLSSLSSGLRGPPSPRSSSLFTSCREVSGDSCSVTGWVGQPLAKISWRQGWGYRKGQWGPGPATSF